MKSGTRLRNAAVLLFASLGLARMTVGYKPDRKPSQNGLRET
jgi:hypothetical protein